MNRKSILILIILSLFITKGFTQNLIPLDWELIFDNDSVHKETHAINMLLSWQRQGISELKPQGELKTTFFVPEMKEPTDFILEVSLLSEVDSILVNNNYIVGNFRTKLIWSATPKCEVKKFIVPKEYLKFNQENIISVTCSKYSYTGGINYNSVKLYANSISDSEVKVEFKPENHLFNRADQVSFNLNINANSDGIASIIIQNDYLDTLFENQLAVKKGNQSYPVDLTSKNLPPGFYTLIVVLKDKGYTGTTSFFAVAPTKIERSSVEPEGYSKYWRTALQELEAVTPDFKVKKVDSLCTKKRNGYIVEMQSIGNKTIYGYYFVPKKKGAFATILNLPGYNYGFKRLDEFLKVDEDIIELALCVRGHGLSKNSFQTEFPLPGYFGYEICDIDKMAYRQIYMDCIRAVEFLLTREEVDKSKIGVLGSSQGGGLALMTAGLASRHISACAYGDPFPTDMKNHIRIRTLIEDELMSYIKYYNNTCSFEDGLRTFDFFDTKYFAKHIKAKTLYVAGLVDDDCPPRLGFSAFNEINAPKEFIIFPKDSHMAESNWKKEMMLFFKKNFDF